MFTHIIHTYHTYYISKDRHTSIYKHSLFIHTYIHTYSTYIHTCIHRQISWITSNRFDTTVRDVTLTEGTTITNGFYVVWSVLTWSRVYRQPVHRVEIRTYFLHSMHNSDFFLYYKLNHLWAVFILIKWVLMSCFFSSYVHTFKLMGSKTMDSIYIIIFIY